VPQRLAGDVAGRLGPATWPREPARL